MGNKLKRTIFASQETDFVASQSKHHVVKVHSFFPVDRANCKCKQLIFEWNQKLGQATKEVREALLAQTPVLECPAVDKRRMNKYQIICKNCGETQGFCWASNETLRDWVDFHYTQWSKGDFWRGCFTPHISPISQQLCFECCCGQDTRDFRANMTMSQKSAESKEAENAIGREFGRSDSKFLVKRVS